MATCFSWLTSAVFSAIDPVGAALSSDRFPDAEIIALCEKTWGVRPTKISFPGGRGRKTVEVVVKDEVFILSKRRSPSRARLESDALRGLADTGLVPKLLRRRDEFLIQQHIDGERLTRDLEEGSSAKREELLLRAGLSLLKLQKTAENEGLLERAPKIGMRENWYLDFARSPERLAETLGLDCGAFDPIKAERLINRLPTSFVKWDARPGNALLVNDRPVWIDWEHCGIASSEDDLVWLLADEWSPIAGKVETTLLNACAAQSDENPEALATRFFVKSTLHSAIRLELIFRKKGAGGWWDPQEGIEHDRVGVSPAHVVRICTRAKRWCEQAEVLMPLRQLFGNIQSRM